ncbi:MAG: Asp/Glu/hydantoin racemase [Erysipelotrichaceae bacterium]|nr:Asp/Glu/hydantoin racemase [Erysipelotrichaceae bacterium]
MKKVVMIHTSAVSLNDLKELCRNIIPNVELVNLIDDSLLEEVKSNNGITASIISRMTTYVQIAEKLKADVIFNQCSSVGEAFDIAKKTTNIKTLKIDEPMAKKAVELGEKIAVVATVKSTMKPSCNLVASKALEAGKKVKITEYLVDGALDILMKEKNQEKHNQLCLDMIRKACEENDVVVLAQGSMTVLIPYLSDMPKPVLTSPKLAIETLKQYLEEADE